MNRQEPQSTRTAVSSEYPRSPFRPRRASLLRAVFSEEFSRPKVKTGFLAFAAKEGLGGADKSEHGF